MKKEVLQKILVMGLPGSGKTTLAKLLAEKLNAVWLNADVIEKKIMIGTFRKKEEIGKLKECLLFLKNMLQREKELLLILFVRLKKTRKYFNADFTIWMDTIEKGRFEDTNQMFQKPKKYDFKVTNKDAINVSKEIVDKIINK